MILSLLVARYYYTWNTDPPGNDTTITYSLLVLHAMADPNPLLPVSHSLHNIIHVKTSHETKPSWLKRIMIAVISSLLILFVFSCSMCTDISESINAHVGREASGGATGRQDSRLVSRGKAVGVSKKTNVNLSESGMQAYPWKNEMLEWQRTAFHFQPQKNWMNDPNGPLLYKSWYHFFYQYNPVAAVWGNIVWGHAISRDLIHWFHLPLAMVADQWYDINGVWTGSATILPDGRIIMLYTGHTNQSSQVQNLAFPEDQNDPLLLNWVKFSGNPVLAPPPSIDAWDFRDPTTAWYTSAGKWRIAIGSRVNDSGIALVYETTDFVHYKLLEEVLHSVPGTGMWECVDFFPVSKSKAVGLDPSANGPDVKHVIKASLDEIRRDYYSVGTYDDINCTWFPDNRNADIGRGYQYDYGVFYASKTFYDQKKKRRVLWGWVLEADSEDADVKKGWASLQGIPRTVVLDPKTGNSLLQWPVEEIESLRLRSHEMNNIRIRAGEIKPIDLDGASQLDILAEFDLEAVVPGSNNKTENSVVASSCGSCAMVSQHGALGPFGLLVLADEALVEQTAVYFYPSKQGDNTFRTFLCTDLTRSSLADDVSKEVYGDRVQVLEGEKLSLRILVDHSIVEAFGQGGRTCITSRAYPTKAINGATRVFLFNNATETDVRVSLTVWQMDSASIRAYNAPEK